MPKTDLNTNKQFMIGNGILAFSVIFVVVIFVYMSMKLNEEKKAEKKYVETYTIELTEGFVGDSVSIFINDSLLLSKQLESEALFLEVNRFADQSALMVVDNRTDLVTTFDLNPTGGKVTLKKVEGKIIFTE